jgi:hypothetical protein
MPIELAILAAVLAYNGSVERNACKRAARPSTEEAAMVAGATDSSHEVIKP